MMDDRQVPPARVPDPWEVKLAELTGEAHDDGFERVATYSCSSTWAYLAPSAHRVKPVALQARCGSSDRRPHVFNSRRAHTTGARFSTSPSRNEGLWELAQDALACVTMALAMQKRIGGVEHGEIHGGRQARREHQRYRNNRRRAPEGLLKAQLC